MALLEFPSQTILGIDFRSTCLESVLRILKVAGESSSMSARLIHMKWHELRQGENSKFLVALFDKGPDLWCERSQQDVISLVEDLLHLTKRVKESMNMAWSSIVGLWAGGGGVHKDNVLPEEDLQIWDIGLVEGLSNLTWER